MIFTEDLKNARWQQALYDPMVALPTGTMTFTTSDPAATVPAPQTLVPVTRLNETFARAELRVR